MLPVQMSPCVVLLELETAREFYVKVFDAKVQFDCGWYVVLKVGQAEFSMMTPQTDDAVPFDGAGLIYNFEVGDVDYEYARLTESGLEVVMPLEDHPWGDRGFSINDPNGISLYIYSVREPDESFKPYIKV